MLLVIDTNIIVSAIKSGIKKDSNGNTIYTKAYKLMKDVFIGKHKISRLKKWKGGSRLCAILVKA